MSPALLALPAVHVICVFIRNHDRILLVIAFNISSATACSHKQIIMVTGLCLSTGHAEAHIVMTEHDSLRLSGGARCVDQDAALVGSLAADNVIQLFLGNIQAELHELIPLCKNTNMPLRTQPWQACLHLCHFMWHPKDLQSRDLRPSAGPVRCTAL